MAKQSLSDFSRRVNKQSCCNNRRKSSASSSLVFVKSMWTIARSFPRKRFCLKSTSSVVPTTAASLFSYLFQKSSFFRFTSVVTREEIIFFLVRQKWVEKVSSGRDNRIFRFFSTLLLPTSSQRNQIFSVRWREEMMLTAPVRRPTALWPIRYLLGQIDICQMKVRIALTSEHEIQSFWLNGTSNGIEKLVSSTALSCRRRVCVSVWLWPFRFSSHSHSKSFFAFLFSLVMRWWERNNINLHRSSFSSIKRWSWRFHFFHFHLQRGKAHFRFESKRHWITIHTNSGLRFQPTHTHPHTAV